MKKSVKLGKENVCMKADTMYLRLRAIDAKKKILLKRMMNFQNSAVLPRRGPTVVWRNFFQLKSLVSQPVDALFYDANTDAASSTNGKNAFQRY